ncbi:MAG TPA: hypothetical protein VMF86_16810 [Stellaceae bacterium]|nr:hypothetical protein [Stellaceae bacterium]
MSADCPTVFGLVPPNTLDRRTGRVGPGARLRRELRRLFGRLAPLRRGRPGGNGPPPDPPDEQPLPDSLWDDPVFWMWMVH